MGSLLILSANATPLVGGQGLNLNHMIEGSREAFDLSVFCRGACPGVETKVVPNSHASRLIARLPLVRRLRDWQTLSSDTNFDSYVAQRLNGARIFQGVTGQCLENTRTI